MRIIAGKYRGRRLKSPPSTQTRPTSDRLRETLFNILAPRIAGSRFLDLCAGTGAVGIEALSRGAESVTFVERVRRIWELIEDNISTLDPEPPEYEVVYNDALGFLRLRAKQKATPFDVIFFDPPYAEDYEEALNCIAQYAPLLLTARGIVIVEHHKKKELAETFGELKRYRIVKQGDSVLSFYGIGA